MGYNFNLEHDRVERYRQDMRQAVLDVRRVLRRMECLRAEAEHFKHRDDLRSYIRRVRAVYRCSRIVEGISRDVTLARGVSREQFLA